MIALLLVAASMNTAMGQQGYPQIINYSPKEYSSSQYVTSPQNWGGIQGEDGRVYIGNTNGVLTFDGKNWQLVDGTQNKRFFKFAKDPTGRIFTGGLNEIGFLTADSTGMIQFRSLLPFLPDSMHDFGRIYDVAFNQGTVYFRSLTHLLGWNGNEFKQWNATGKIRGIFSSSDELFVSQTTGLYRLSNNTLKKVLENAEFNALNFKAAVPITDNGASKLLLVSAKSGIHLLDKGAYRHIPSPLDSVAVFSCTLTQSGSLAVGTNGNGLFIVNRNGEVTAIYNETSLLQQNQVVYTFEDSQGGLWTTLFSGVSRISHNDKLSFITKDHGLGAISVSVKTDEDALLVGTLGGLYVLSKGDNGFLQPKKDEMVIGTVTGLIKANDEFLVFSDQGVYKRNSAGITTLLSNTKQISVAIASVKHEGTIYVAFNDNSIYRSTYKAGKWILESQLAQLTHKCYSLQEDVDGNIWATYDGISKLHLAEKPDSVIVTAFDSLSGLTPEMGSYIEVTRIGKQIIFGTANGVYGYNAETERLQPSGILGKRFENRPNSAFNITETSANDVWVTSNEYTLLVQKDNGSFKYDSLPLISSGVSDFWNVFEDDKHRIWASGTEALVCYNPHSELKYDQGFNTLIHRVRLLEDSVIFNGFFVDSLNRFTKEQPQDRVQTFDFSHNDVSFSFSAPFFHSIDKIQYTYKLVGNDKDWSGWHTTNFKEYTNLGPGEYEFVVKAKNVFGVVGKEAKYRFVIAPPWYKTYWALAGYIFIVSISIWGLVSLATYRLKQSKIRLQQIVDERTSEIQQNVIQLRQQKEVIEKEREKSDKLLLNILPEATANELKQKGYARSQMFENVTVLFTDFKDFTKISENLTAEELVAELNTCFSAFDEIVDEHGLEKIKTIGDSYMCVGGLPVPREDHAIQTAKAALQMQAFIKARKESMHAKGLPYFEMRCGINSGPVIAGVVGLRKFQYDVWGDTVNLASRMESSGEIGMVNISQATYELIKNEFECTYRGEVEAKNKGKVKMYFIQASNSES